MFPYFHAFTVSEFLRARGVPQDVIENFEYEKVIIISFKRVGERSSTNSLYIKVGIIIAGNNSRRKSETCLIVFIKWESNYF